MTGSDCLLDTVILVGYLRGNPTVKQRITTTTPYISIISIGELYVGAYRSQSLERENQKISQLLEFVTVLVCDDTTAKHYAHIKHNLWRKGRPIPENDIWIAATALQYKLPLISRDAHFIEINEMLFEQW